MIRVLIVDDEELVRAGLRLILQSSDDILVVAEATDGGGAIAAVRRHRPDVILMDVRMPGCDGMTAAEQIRDIDRTAKIIMLTTFDLDEYVHRALRAGAVGFLLKDIRPRDLISAVSTVASGSAILAPTVTKRLISTFTERDGNAMKAARAQLSILTDREIDVVDAVARGLSNAEIGRDLAISEGTVKAHISRSLAKLGLSNRVQIAILAYEARREQS
ncbi:response regulator [Mangrovihabitans endophyticus]|uniref:DNA-binding response regulator n=1 Tax=Mangrovihabitans endophyticus TaxID=1751298 RepID=A0A8J3BVU5_9ACTN|nr:response regulator transcription factor [Mangrovihabitans endophyticus]GGK73005.1 DNA-binding response regulator [Mangrovihabitans endophyticus]